MKRTKRLLCLVLVFVFVAALLPAAAYADPPDEACRSPLAQENGGRHYWIIDHVDQPGCTEGGTQYWVCEYCGKTYAEALPALGHNWTEDEPAPGFAPATCIEGTTMIRTCGDCGAQETFEQPPLGHDWETVTTEPHGLVDGSVVSTCRRCGLVETETISAATNIFNLVRHVPEGAEGAEELVIIAQPEGGLISYGGGDSCTLTVAASGGVPPYTYEWHRVDDFLDRHSTMSVISAAAVEKFRGTQESYQSQSSSFASVFHSTAQSLGLSLGKEPKETEDTQERSFTALGDAVLAVSYGPFIPVSSAGNYYCVVRDNAGNKASSAEAAVGYHLHFTVQPQNMNLFGKKSVKLSCAAVGSGDGNVLYSLRGPDGSFIATGLLTGSFEVSELGEYQFEALDLVSGEELSSDVVQVYKTHPPKIGTMGDLTLGPEQTTTAVSLIYSGGVSPRMITLEHGDELIYETERSAYTEIVLDLGLGDYRATITDSMQESYICEFSVSYAPLKIDKQPVGGMLPKGEGASQLFIAMADGEEPFTYTLYRNGEVCGMSMDGSTHSDYVSESGEYYYCIDDNTGRSAESEHVVLEDYDFRIDRIEIEGEFDDSEGRPSMQAVIVGGEAPISFVWTYYGLDGKAKPQQLSTVGAVANADLPGVYGCVATDNSGASAVKQDIHVLYTGEEPLILIQPESKILPYAENGWENLIFTCEAISARGDNELRYDWEFLLGGEWLYLYTGKTLHLDTGNGSIIRCVVTDLQTGAQAISYTATVVAELVSTGAECKNPASHFLSENNNLRKLKDIYLFSFEGGTAPYVIEIYSREDTGQGVYDVWTKTRSLKAMSELQPFTTELLVCYEYIHVRDDGTAMRKYRLAHYYAVVTDSSGQTAISALC